MWMIDSLFLIVWANRIMVAMPCSHNFNQSEVARADPMWPQSYNTRCLSSHVSLMGLKWQLLIEVALLRHIANTHATWCLAVSWWLFAAPNWSIYWLATAELEQFTFSIWHIFETHMKSPWEKHVRTSLLILQRNYMKQRANFITVLIYRAMCICTHI